jgi:hypothetical protein
MRLRWFFALLLVALSLPLVGCPEAPLPFGACVDVCRTPDGDGDGDTGDDAPSSPTGDAAGDADRRLATAPSLR